MNSPVACMDEMSCISGYNSESSQTSCVVKHPAHYVVEDRAHYAIKNWYNWMYLWDVTYDTSVYNPTIWRLQSFK